MKKKILRKEAEVTGPCYWFWQSKIKFLPAHKPGWYLRTKSLGDVPIDFRIVKSRMRRLALVAGGTELEVIEHILALKMLIGLDEVILVPDGRWPPYIGGAGGYAKQLEGKWEQTKEDFETICPNIPHFYYTTRRGRDIVVEAKRSREFRLIVSNKWDPLNSHTIVVTEEKLNDPVFVQRILDAKPQGYYRGWKALLIILFSMFGWPNMKYISWMKDYKDPRQNAEDWTLHSVQDTLGGLSLAHSIKIPKLELHRGSAGHLEDHMLNMALFS
jgi:UDP-3-O-acyl-N-acetylglucosamine deacetylase